MVAVGVCRCGNRGIDLGDHFVHFSLVCRQQDISYWFDLREWVRGLTALVLLFDLYAIYQHFQLQGIRRQLTEQQALRQAEEKYRAIFEDAVVGIFQITPGGSSSKHQPSAGRIARLRFPEQLMAGGLNVAHATVCRSQPDG